MIGKTSFYLIIVIGIVAVLILLSQLVESSWWVLNNKKPADMIKSAFNLTNDKKVDGEILVGQNKWQFELAKTAAARARGLSGRKFLSKKEGMLFVFNKPAIHSFWMKGMLFPLDFVWIKSITNNQGVVVGVSENAPPLDIKNIKFYSPPEPADLVLEIRAGLVAETGVKKGDVVRINFSD